MAIIERSNNMSHLFSTKYPGSFLQHQQFKRMYRAGFTRYEIKYTLLIGGKEGADTLQKMFDNPKWAKAFEHTLDIRSRFTSRQLERGFTRDQIREKFNIAERGRGTREEEETQISPMTFLKEEYRRGMKSKADFADMISDTDKAKLNEWSKKHFGRLYRR